MVKKSLVLGLALVLILAVSSAAWAFNEVYFSYIPSGTYSYTPNGGSTQNKDTSSFTIGVLFMSSTSDNNQFQIGGGAEDTFSGDFWSISGYMAVSYRLVRNEMDPRLIGKVGLGMMMGMGDYGSGNDMVDLSLFYALGPSIKLSRHCRAELLYVENNGSSMNYSNVTLNLGYSF